VVVHTPRQRRAPRLDRRRRVRRRYRRGSFGPPKSRRRPLARPPQSSVHARHVRASLDEDSGEPLDLALGLPSAATGSMANRGLPRTSSPSLGEARHFVPAERLEGGLLLRDARPEVSSARARILTDELGEAVRAGRRYGRSRERCSKRDCACCASGNKKPSTHRRTPRIGRNLTFAQRNHLVLRRVKGHRPSAYIDVCAAQVTSGLATPENARWLLIAALVLFPLGLVFYLFVICRFDFRQLAVGRGDHWITGGAIGIAALAAARIAAAASALGILGGGGAALQDIA